MSEGLQDSQPEKENWKPSLPKSTEILRFARTSRFILPVPGSEVCESTVTIIENASSHNTGDDVCHRACSILGVGFSLGSPVIVQVALFKQGEPQKSGH
jgi:hypothetical protein